MQINPVALKDLRRTRGWTQQHLADACGLSLRTIQRLEREGAAANETVLAICAALSIQREQLSVIPKVESSQVGPASAWRQYVVPAAMLVLGFVLGAAVMYAISV
jgi:transcriptional regulator with XRE-family HTH domain